MKWMACLLVASLAGCATAEDPAPPDPGPGAPSETAPTAQREASQPAPPAPQPLLARSWHAKSHREGAALVAIEFELARGAECDLGGFVHHPVSFDYDSDAGLALYARDEGRLRALDSGGWTAVQGGHVRAAGVDSRTATDPVQETVYGVYWDVFGFGDTFTSGGAWIGYGLEAGTYVLEVIAARAVDGGEGWTEGGSILAGLSCSKEARLLGAHDAAGVLDSSSAGRGGTSLYADLALTVSQGATEVRGAGECRLTFGHREVQGELRLEGLGQTVPLDYALGWTLGTWEWPSRPVSAAWDIAGTGYWTLHAGCFSPLPGGQAAAGWSSPF